jgi:hypothetical protein
MTTPPSTQPDWLTDFHKILELFGRETTIYKNQIKNLSLLVDKLQKKETEGISIMSHEQLNELRSIINNLALNIAGIDQQSISNSSANTTTTRNINDYLCQICLDIPRDCILEPCMHFSLCSRCVSQLIESKCPICRRQIEFYQNVFIS